MRRATLAIFLAVAACGSPPPRDITWFEAHPRQAAEVLQRCGAGARSSECENARAAIGRLKASARMERYRKGFE